MKHTYALNAFMKWLPANLHRFNNKPCNIRRHNQMITFNLTGVTNLLQWYVCERQASLTVRHKIPKDKSDFWDAFIDFEVFPEHNSPCQYYCSMCESFGDENYKRQYYPSKLALWESHCFENILKWSNEKITSDKILVLNLTNLSTQAVLLSPDKWVTYKQQQKEKGREKPFKVIPICTEKVKLIKSIR